MKPLHLSIIIAATAAAIAIFLLMFANLFDIGSSGHIQKLIDFYHIRNLYNPNDTGSDLGVSVGDFDWSDDGKFAVFAFCHASPNGCTLWKITHDGKEVKQIVMPMKFEIIGKIRILSNDIFFDGWYDGQNNQDVFKFSLDNMTLQRLTYGGKVNVFDVTPDGNLVYQEVHDYPTKVCPLQVNDTSGNDWAGYYTVLWIADQHGNKIRPVYNGTEVFQDLAASPKGNNIIFTDITHPQNSQIHVMMTCRPFGGGPPFSNIEYGLKLLHTDTGKITLLYSFHQGFLNPRWVSESSVLYTVEPGQCIPDKTGNVHYCSSGFLKLINISDGGSKLIYGKENPPYTEVPGGVAISRDGKSIIFAVNEDVNDGIVNGKGIYVFELDASLR